MRFVKVPSWLKPALQKKKIIGDFVKKGILEELMKLKESRMFKTIFSKINQSDFINCSRETIAIKNDDISGLFFGKLQKERGNRIVISKTLYKMWLSEFMKNNFFIDRTGNKPIRRLTKKVVYDEIVLTMIRIDESILIDSIIMEYSTERMNLFIEVDSNRIVGEIEVVVVV